VAIVLGGITGMVLGTAGFDVLYHDTYYVIGHFHLVLSMGGFSIIFAVIYHYWFVIFRVRYNKFLAIFHFFFFFVGELLSFIPALFLGMSGMPRRINDYPSVFAGWHGFSSLGHGLVLLSLLMFFIVVIEAKYTGETFTAWERVSFGIPYYSNRVSAYLFLLIHLRAKSRVNSI
jgi:heme/copper-type cytochrome/quinol oxidase subunit 1